MSNKKINSKKLVIIIVAVILAIIIIPTTIYCIVEKETPVQMVTDMFSSNEKQLVGKWQGDADVTAYEFYEDGSYDSYLSTFSFSGNYTLDGNKLTLTNPATTGKVVYKIKVTENSLSLTLYEENGTPTKDKDGKLNYKRVSHISTKPLNDFLGDLADELKTEE